tara:strand:- start:181 stop:876 length:696 start_codon:yes stop_codon:yes gene_type:complete
MSKKNQKVLEVSNLSYTYQNPSSNVDILDNLNFNLNEGEMVALVGPSGSGKSTFLNCIGLLDKPSKGLIKILGKKCNVLLDSKLTKIRSEHIGFIFQSHRLFPEFSSIENVVIPQLILGVEKKTAYKNASEILKFLGLQNRLNHRPANLSGRESQRVAIARALANAPKIILADEPTGNLDKFSSDLVFDLLFKVVKASKISCIVATHNQLLAEKMDKIYAVENKKIKLIKK